MLMCVNLFDTVLANFNISLRKLDERESDAGAPYVFKSLKLSFLQFAANRQGDLIIILNPNDGFEIFIFGTLELLLLAL